MLKKIMAVLCLFLMCFTGTALADIPDPSGRPRPRPRPWPPRPPAEFRIISSRSYEVSLNDDEKPALEITYAAPQYSTLSYSVTDGGEEVFSSGIDTCENDQSTVKIYFPKVFDGCMNVDLKMVCRLNARETNFGVKHSDNDLYYKQEVITYTVEAKDGTCTVYQK